MTYGDIVSRFFYEAVPTLAVSPSVRFEAISAAVLGTKQLRYGPLPTPEVQTTIRAVLRDVAVVDFFVPWGAVKQETTAKLDVLEFMALRQLACVRDALTRFGVASRFHFRLDDNSDRYLLGEDRVPQIAEYTLSFEKLVEAVLPGAWVNRETKYATYEEFRSEAEKLTPAFYRVIKGLDDPSALAKVGWKGAIPQEQLDYYYAAYRVFYPGQDHAHIAAKYFAGALTRHRLKATTLPPGPHVSVSFSKPVPGHPLAGNRVFYRTLPERYTHHHKAPWGGRGFMAVTPDGLCGPRYVEAEAADRLTEHVVRVGDAEVAAPYLEV